MGDERIDEGSRLISGTGMNHKARGFINNDQVFVFVNHSQRDDLGLGFRLDGGRNGGFYGLARFQFVAGFHNGIALDRNMAFRDKPLEAGAAYLGEGGRQKSIEAVRSFNGCFEYLGDGRVHG